MIHTVMVAWIDCTILCVCAGDILSWPSSALYTC